MPDRLTDERLRELHQTWLIESEVDEPMADDPPAVLSALTELLELRKERQRWIDRDDYLLKNNERLREEVERLNEEIKEWKEYNRCRTD
jgi:hypothetical protein